MEQIKLNAAASDAAKGEPRPLGREVWKKVFASPLYQQTSILFKQIFKRNIGLDDFDAMGITREEWRCIRGPYEYIPFPFCELIYKTKEGKRRCEELDKQIFARISTTLKTDIFTCYTGLTEVAIPIIVHNKYCGCFSTYGGLLLHKPNETEWQQIVERVNPLTKDFGVGVKDTGVDLEQLKEAYFEITPISKELLEIMLKLINVQIEEIIRAAIETEEHKKRIAELEKTLYEKYQFASIIGQSNPMREVYKLLDKAITTDYPVVIQGETGTGKELVAKALHFNGLRKAKPFIPENCAALASGVLESELFGHIKGAFTGADKDKKGLFELADGGTLFLDEVSIMDQEMQKKLLRALQECEIRPVGGKSPIKVDVRVISATNQDLKQLVKKGTFRDDLYYRLNVITINLPPLRERQEDIPLLVNHFLEKIAKETNTKIKVVDKEAIKLLINYNWPGNVRELENEIKRCCVLTGSSKTVMHLHPVRKNTNKDEDISCSLKHNEELSNGAGEAELITPEVVSHHLTQPLQEHLIQSVKSFADKSLKEVIDETERKFISQALQKANYNKTICAKMVGLTIQGLRKKIKRLGIK
ncbi:MAG: sigma 54-interacting transcriptional regulator [Planctomycetota bacterium]